MIQDSKRPPLGFLILKTVFLRVSHGFWAHEKSALHHAGRILSLMGVPRSLPLPSLQKDQPPYPGILKIWRAREDSNP